MTWFISEGNHFSYRARLVWIACFPYFSILWGFIRAFLFIVYLVHVICSSIFCVSFWVSLGILNDHFLLKFFSLIQSVFLLLLYLMSQLQLISKLCLPARPPASVLSLIVFPGFCATPHTSPALWSSYFSARISMFLQILALVFSLSECLR